MIYVTCLDGRRALVNADQIETIEQTPDTIISFTSGHKLLVRDHPDELASRVIDYRRAVAGAGSVADPKPVARTAGAGGAAMSTAKRRRYDVASFWGVGLGIGLILVGQALEGGSILSLLQPTAALIVFGGTTGAVMLSFSRNDSLRAFRALRTVFLWDGEPLSLTITNAVQYAVKARKDGILSLDSLLNGVQDPFEQKAVRLLVDATNPQVLRELLEVESHGREEYDEVPAKVFEAAGGYTPTIGILGAVIGLIQVMQHLSEPSKLGAGIAVAFVATVYGVGSANLFFLPAATKLRMKARHEARRRELIIEGVLAIQDGMIPRMIEEKLCGFASQITPAPGRPPHAT